MSLPLRMSLALFLVSGTAAAGVGTLPGSSLDAPGAKTVGAPASSATLAEMWTDKNGDGVIDHSEVVPGSQIDQRFPTRDKNRDERLTTDEYYYTAPPVSAAAPATPTATAYAAPAPAATAPAPASGMWTDSNGDGVIDRAEVAPGSQLAQRFSTRDKNNDGRLSDDEYYHAH